MIKRIFLFTAVCCTVSLFAGSVAYCQVSPVSMTELIDSSRVVIVGEVYADSVLAASRIDSTNQPGYYSLGTDLDGHFYMVCVTRILKGDSVPDTIAIYVRENEYVPDEGTGVSLETGKKYLLFLNPRAMDSTIANKYNLPSGTNYFPSFGGYGAALLERADALERLKRAEDYLSSRPRIPSSDLPVSLLLDTLMIYTEKAFSNGRLGDRHFVDFLDRIIDIARKRLENEDSLLCYVSVQNYQREIDRTYEKTLKGETNGKVNENRFVTAEAWNILHYYSGYILDRLPRKGVK